MLSKKILISIEKDALHLACAIHNKCDYFITCDDRFIRTITKNQEFLKDVIGDIQMFNPIDFIRKEWVFLINCEVTEHC